MADIADLLGRPVRPIDATVNGMRLTLESGEPVSTTNQTAKTTLYLTPYLSNRLSLYYDSRWNIFETAEVSIAIPATTTTIYDVFAYWTGAAVVLELVAWTNDTTRATAIARQDGVWIKSGDATRRFIGTIRTTSVSGQCEDSFTKRLVWNWQNQVKRPCWTTNTTTSWTYATNSYREHNNGTGQIRFEFVCGLPQSVYAVDSGRFTGSSHSALNIVAVDATDISGYYFGWVSNTNSYPRYGLQNWARDFMLAVGYHYITQVEYIESGTATNWGNGSTTAIAFGAKVDWES